MKPFTKVLTDHGGSSGQSCLGSLSKVVHCCGPTIGHLQVGVDVDAPRDHHLSLGLDTLHTSRYDQVVSDLPVEDTCC